MVRFYIVLAILLSSLSLHAKERSTLEQRIYDLCRPDLGDEYCDAFAERSREVGIKALDFLTYKVRPKAMAAYKAYDQKVGRHIGTYFWQVYDKTKPSAQRVYQDTRDYWYNKNPEFFDDLGYGPTPIKMAQEKLLFGFLDLQLEKGMGDGIKSHPIYEIATQMLIESSAVRTGKVSPPTSDQQRLERLLNDLRGASLDKEMANCFKIYAVPSEIMNSFNTVCSIFVHEPMYKLLNDDELRAVIAHEMGHGVNGDSLKTFAALIKEAFKHFGKLLIEELHWLLTDETLPYFEETMKNADGTPGMILHRVASNMPDVEHTADINGAKILNKAGYSAQSLIIALIKIHKGAYTEGENPEDKDSFRKYPGLEARINAIKKNMKF